jgi:hypothetical protein
MAVIYYCFVWLLIILNAYFVIKVIIAMRRRATVESKRYISRTTSHLKWYPIILIISFIPATVHRIMDLTVEIDWYFLIYIQAILDAIQGGMFVLVYSLTPEVREALRQLYNKSINKRRESAFFEGSSFSSSESSSKLRSELNAPRNSNINEEKSENLI